ncbi:MAG: DUF177 domain-containing protein [Clostridiaceae bacterium]
MIIDISKVLSRKNYSEETNFIVECKELSKLYSIVEPIKFQGVINNISDSIGVSGKAKGIIEINCSRCLGLIKYVIDADIDEIITNNIDNRDEEIIFINKDQIDLSQVIENDILFSIPVKVLCDENCKGLCQRCGVNKNINHCSCSDGIVDPRLEKLKDMLSSTKEV